MPAPQRPNNPYRSPATSEPAATPSGPYRSYEDVPWYRRSGLNSAMTLFGFFCFPPLLWAVCIILVTGDVYFNTRRKDGSLKTWSIANKVVAWVLLAANAYIFYNAIMRTFFTMR